MYPTLALARVAACRHGNNATPVCPLRSGWVVMGDGQFRPGDSLRLPDPVVSDLNALDSTRRAVFVEDMVFPGDALLERTDACRINDEILGNSEPALHAHVFPRFADEPEGLSHRPAWSYDRHGAPAFDLQRDRAFMSELRQRLGRFGVNRCARPGIH